MTRTSHSRPPAPSRTLALSLLLFALIALPDPLPAAPAADYDVLPADRMDLSKDLSFRRVQIPTATPLGFPGRDLSRPASLSIALATLPAELLALGRHDLASLPGVPPSLQFVMSAATDSRGNQWFGCEDSGVFCYSPATSKWRQFTTKDGLGDDNAYALAVDHLGRIWAGHLNHGLSVYVPSPSKQESGLETGTWQTYEVVAGLSREGTLAGHRR